METVTIDRNKYTIISATKRADYSKQLQAALRQDLHRSLIIKKINGHTTYSVAEYVRPSGSIWYSEPHKAI